MEVLVVAELAVWFSKNGDPGLGVPVVEALVGGLDVPVVVVLVPVAAAVVEVLV